MLSSPKGLKYWIEKDEGYVIADDAPEWAKREFEEYQEQMKDLGKPDEDGIIRV